MHVYCTKVLHLSDAEAFLRITAGRAARAYPLILEMLADGRLHLSAISRLAPHLTAENHTDLLVRATRRTRREVEELVAGLAPRPDAPTVVRKLPAKSGPEVQRLALGTVDTPATPTPLLCPDRVGSSTTSGPPARIETLAPARYKVQFTASAAFREKLERLEARRYAKTRRPKTKDVPDDDGSRYLPAALRRAVNARDENRCRFVDAQRRRCPERHRLEYHHRDPFGLGGARTLANVCLMCRAHNLYLAERDYGKEKMDRHRRPRDGDPPRLGLA